MSKKGLKTMLVCIVLLIGLVTLFACNKSDVADKDGQTKVIVKIQNEDGSIYKENVVFSDLFTLSLQKEEYTGRLYRDADFLKPLTKDSKVKNGDTVYVKWTINSYTVTFMDGKTVLKTEKVQHGSAATAPEVSEKDGKTFVGWDKKFDVVTSDLTINAVYDVKTFTVTFKDGEKVLSTQTVEYDKSATAPTVTPAPGKKHSGWDVEFDHVQDNLVVNATFEDIIYTVKFVADGITRREEKVKYGGKVEAPDAPEVTGKTFERWDGTAEYVTENVTITAIYKLNSYTIKFILNNDEDDVVLKQDYGTAITAPTPKMSGHTFVGWDKTVPETVPANDVTFTAQWTVNQYTITFVLGNGKDNVVLMQDYGTAITAPVPEDTAEQSFDGWDKTVPETMPAEDVTITAKWKTRQYTLTFIDHNDQEIHKKVLEWGAPVEEEYYTANGKVEENITGPFQYEGWYDQSDTGKTIIEDFSELKMPTRDLTYVLKVKLTKSAIGEFTVNNLKEFTFTENNSAVFTVNGTPYAGVTYKYVWTIYKGTDIYKTEETAVPSLTLQNLAAGEYLATVKIVASKEGCGSVESDSKAGEKLTVLRADILGIKVTGGTFTYGNKNAEIGISGHREGDVITYKKDGTGEEFKENVDLWALNAGEYTYYVKVERNENYNAYIASVAINIEKAAVTIRFTPDKNEVVYGDELPALSAYVGETKIGMVAKEDYALKLNEISFSGIATYVDECSIEVKNFSNDYYNTTNFNITFNSPDKITVKKAPLNVNIAEISNLTYGDDLPEIGYEIKGWKNGDDKSEYKLLPETKYAKKSAVGTYSFTYNVSGEKIGYYDVTVNTVEFTVKQRAATITINKVNNIIYGDKVPVLKATVEGVLDGDSLSYKLEPGYTVGAKPGDYTARVEYDENAEANKNYSIIATGTTFKVGKKGLTITLGSKRVVTGKEYKVDVGKLEIVGLVEGDTVTGYVTITKDEAGVYTANDFDKSNLKFDSECYEVIKYDLTVEFVKVDFKIHFEDHEVVYDGQNHNVSVTAEESTYTITYGTKEGVYDLTDAPEYKNAGVYVTYFKVVDTSVGDAEYEGFVSLTIKQKEVVLTVKTYTITYGDTLPEFSYDVTGLIGGDVLSGEARYSVDGITGGNVGTYDINVDGLSANDNYAITVVPGTLTINQKSIAVVWSTKDKYVYSPDGQEMPAATYDGKSAKVTTNGEFKNAGTYTFTATDESGNYTLTNAVLNVVIAKATYSGIVHDPLSGVYNPAKTLKDYALAEGFTWVDASEKPVCTKPEYAAIYNADSDNYENFELNIAIDLQKAKVALKDGVVGFDYDGTSHEVKAAVTYNGVALDTSLYSLTYDGKTSKTYTDAGTHACLIEISADNYALPENTYLYVKVKGVKVGNNYYTIEDALFNSKSGDTVEFISAAKEVSFAPLDIATAIYADNAYRTVKAGVTLKLASDEDSSAKIGKPTYGNGVGNYVDTDSSKIKQKLILNESTVLEVYGNILIQGLLGVNGSGLSGHTSGNHSQIINNGTINLNSGANLDLRGYIKGAGTIEARSGAIVYSPFVVYDYRGGTNTATVYRKGNIAPFRIYEMPNIQCNYSILYEAEHKGYLDLYASDQHRTAVATIFGKGSAMIIMEDSTAHITTTYERTGNLIGETTLTMTGKVKMGVLKIKVTTTVTVAMNEVRFPMPWNFTINVGDGLNPTTFTLPDDYKMMTGATVNVKKSATVNLTGTLLIYKSFTDTPFGGTVYPNKGAAKLNVEGVVNAIGGIAGEVHGINGGKVIIGNKAILSITEKEGNSGSTKSWQALVGAGEFVTVATISEVAKVVNADNSTVAAATNKTYNYNNGKWQ